MNRRQKGAYFEEVAARFLHANGVRVIEQNFRCRTGEIDLVARDGKYTVFVEVKFRTGKKQGQPEEAVDFRKRRQICRVSDYYRHRHGMDDTRPVRFDVIAILNDKEIPDALRETDIRWFKNAFSYIPA